MATQSEPATRLSDAERRGVVGWTTLVVAAVLGLLLGLLELADGGATLLVTVVLLFAGLTGVALIATARVDELREELRREPRG